MDKHAGASSRPADAYDSFPCRVRWQTIGRVRLRTCIQSVPLFARPFRSVRNHPALHSTLLLLALAAPARAADPLSVEDRLRALEAKVGALEQENAALRQQLAAPAAAATPAPAPSDRNAAAAISPVVVVPNGHENRLALGGYTQMQAEFGDTGDARFAGTGDRIYARRSRIWVTGNFAEHFDFKVEGIYDANTNGVVTGARMQANEISISWVRYPAANIRLGQLKPAFSLELLSAETNGVIIERTIGSERIGDGRQIGAEVTGALFNQRVNYIVFVGNGNGSNTSANDNNKFLQSARVDVVVHDSPAAGRLVVGADAIHSTDTALSKIGPGFDAVPGGAVDDLFTGTRDGWALDATWHFGLFDLTTEMLRMRYRPVDSIPAASFLGDSWHATAAYFIVPTRLQAAVRREHYDPNTAVTGNSTENWWVGLNYYLKGSDLKFMVDYVFGRPAGLPNDHGRFFTRFQMIY